MRIRRSVPILLVVVLVAAALTLIVQLRKHAPPEAARLLPGADGFLYVNLQWMRRANVTGDLPKVPHDPEYEDFIQATGFQFERDLDEAAFAIHYPSVAARGKPANPDQPRFSEIFVGKIEGEKLSAYLRKLATSVDNYRSIDIYNIPLEGRTLRVAILAVDTVAASNHNDPQVIRGIIERSRKLASPFGGPAFLRQYYKEVPFASLGWAIFRAQPSNTPSGSLDASMLFSKPAVVVASVRYLGSVHFKAEAITDSVEEGKQVSDRLSSFLTIFRAAEITVAAPGPDASLKQFFESLTVAQHGERAELSAILPTELIRKMVAESPEHFTPQPPAPVPSDVHK
jgi:hypothetical protein